MNHTLSKKGTIRSFGFTANSSVEDRQQLLVLLEGYPHLAEQNGVTSATIASTTNKLKPLVQALKSSNEEWPKPGSPTHLILTTIGERILNAVPKNSAFFLDGIRDFVKQTRRESSSLGF